MCNRSGAMGLQVLHASVTEDQLGYVLNGAIVGLCARLRHAPGNTGTVLYKDCYPNRNFSRMPSSQVPRMHVLTSLQGQRVKGVKRGA